MADEKEKDLPLEVESEVSDTGEKIRTIVLDTVEKQFYLGREKELPDHIVLVNLHFGIGFAIPFENAHILSHMIHDGLEVLTGGELHEEETETDKKIITH